MLVFFAFNETSPAAAGTAASSSPVTNTASYLPAGVAGPLDDVVYVGLTAELVGATGGTLDVYMQTSPDEGATWVDKVHFPQLANGAAAIKYHASIAPHPQATADTTIVVGENLSPALAANVVVQGLDFNRMRLVMVAGTSTSAGASVVVKVCGQRTRVSN